MHLDRIHEASLVNLLGPIRKRNGSILWCSYTQQNTVPEQVYLESTKVGILQLPHKNSTKQQTTASSKTPRLLFE